MDESSKSAYRHLGLTGYAAIQGISSGLKVGAIHIGSARHLNKSIKLINLLSEWLGKLMDANVNDFVDFNEKDFWAEHKTICEAYVGYNIETYKAVYEDSLSHCRGNS
ncbi:hypothetical protein KUV95_17120 [Microbulbifer agarilyticus]|uniref:hypothetical protein n=1 Tax=Microbulbifer agarilyticus TaxID=260552 RepID=UPI001C941331|nr:hypothetical protein [Microbulbifer agarilyticus]MBY6192161.1 hypothetical protein [Microbulbifer agarilyticus]MBY6213272.1 hypothetical protein [Microbulbifer agarilyticus]